MRIATIAIYYNVSLAFTEFHVYCSEEKKSGVSFIK